jgi:hypothetical protein
MSACLSIALVASSAARAAAFAVGRATDFTVSPSSTRRRVASESVGISVWFSAHFTRSAQHGRRAESHHGIATGRGSTPLFWFSLD